MKCLYVNTHFAPDYEFGGVVESASKIHKYIQRLMPFFVVCVSKNSAAVNSYLCGCGICFPSIFFHRIGFSVALISPLWKLIREHDLIAVNGIFTFPVTLAQLFAVLQKKPFIVSVRGGLEPWRLQQKKYRKAIFNKLIAFPLLRKASCIHVTSDDEYSNLLNLGFTKLKLISNGIDNELIESFTPKKNCFFPEGKFVFLFLSRTDKEKGLDILLRAYARFVKANPVQEYVLAIVGPDHQGYLAQMNIEYEKNNIYRLEGVYGEKKFQIIHESSCVILPSYSENFGNIVAEGMGMAKPVITTTGTPWHVLKEKKLGFYVEPTVEEIFFAMQSIYHLSDSERDSMGQESRRYIFENMSWAGKAIRFTDLFASILNTQQGTELIERQPN